MKKLFVALMLIVPVAGCALEGSGQPAGSSPDSTSRAATPVDIETWCARQTPDRCVEGLVYIDWNPGRERCVFTVADDSRRFWELCDESFLGGVPGTTVPTAESEAERLAAERAYEDEVARRLPALDERAVRLLTAVHRGGVVTAGLLFTDPQSLDDVERLASESGATLVAAWRTDFVCLRGIDDWPTMTPSRFAYFDGEERAERLRQEMENSTTPVTGAHIPLTAFAVMEEEAAALRGPGVLLEAVQAEVPVAALGSLLGDPAIAQVRIADFPNDWVDLSNPPVPECENR